MEREKAFRLGELLTEAFHPKTRELSQMMERDIHAGIGLLQSVDQDIPPALERIFAQESFGRLVDALGEAMRTGHRIFFTGCGSTGRLSILLEAAWREFRRDVETQDVASLQTQRQDLCVSVMAGGDFALIKAVEGFEDFPDFGRYQIKEAGIQSGDVVVAITEGGETPFVIGTAWQGLDAGATVFFIYNNPTDLLREHVQRSREVIDEPRIHKLDLATGPMAITGSTRMQATTVELLVVGAALEMAMVQSMTCGDHTTSWWAQPTLRDGWQRQAEPAELADGSPDTEEPSASWRLPLPPANLDRARGAVPTAFSAGSASSRDGRAGTLTPQDYRRQFENLLSQLSSPQAVAAIARAVELEEGVYRKHGLVTYLADSLMLDVLTDTTERSPTFMIPPFRKDGDIVSPVSWAFVKNPFQPTRDAWREMLQREPRGLTWGPEVFRQLNAPAHVQANPPKLDNAEIHRFRIGNEPDPSRTEAPDSVLIRVGDLSNHPSSIIHHQFPRTAAITFGPTAGRLDVDEHIHIPCDLPASPLRLWEHLTIKLILNTLSTATMVRMGRVVGNAMVWVSPSNKKLIDRGTRLIAQSTGHSYERACEALHEAMDEIARRAQAGEEVPSPVALAIERIRTIEQEKTP